MRSIFIGKQPDFFWPVASLFTTLTPTTSPYRFTILALQFGISLYKNHLLIECILYISLELRQLICLWLYCVQAERKTKPRPVGLQQGPHVSALQTWDGLRWVPREGDSAGLHGSCTAACPGTGHGSGHAKGFRPGQPRCQACQAP